MNQMPIELFDELEEGEIPDDVPEPIIPKKPKPLPRRYVINDKNLKSRRRKRHCKHSTERHKRKDSKSNFHSPMTPSIKHRKKCPKHNSLLKHFVQEEIIDIGSKHKESHYSPKKVPLVKSAFKNYTSPPRKVINVDNYKLLNLQPKTIGSSNKKSSPGHKRSPNKFKNISNFNDSANKKQLGKGLSEKSEISKLKSENHSQVEVIQLDVTDDEDEDELRRIALATCLKKSTNIPEIILSEDSSSKINSSESELPTAIDSDNYEIVDMDVDNDSENTDKVGDQLFVIDTTPTYFNDINVVPSGSLFDQPSNINHINDNIVNGFLPNINIDDVYHVNLNNDVALSQNINNDLYTNFEIDNSRLPSSQMDDEFEEELLRAELIANMKSMKENNANPPREEDILTSDPGLVVNNFTDLVSKDTRVVKLKSDLCNIDRDDSVNGLGFRDERTVSIVKDVMVKETPSVTKSRIVSSSINNLAIASNTSVRKGADIKVKLNNVHPIAGSALNITTLPQERIVISLNNETSSEESNQEDEFQQREVVKNPAVASLEALISNARQESDGKKSSPYLNGTSDALSCLSKAQQEEYNSLIKILAKKKDPYVQHTLKEIKKVAEDPNLILLKKKIEIARSNYDKEKGLILKMTKELVKKKRSYVVAKVKTQQLKEQLVAAEKVRKANLQLWNKCAIGLQTLKTSVYKRHALINSLQTKINTLFPETVSNGHSSISNTPSEQEYLLR